MSTTNTETEPGLKSLSQLLRLGSEQGLTDERLNYLLSSGVLARVFRVNPSKSINLIALERVLGLIDPLDEVRRPILVKHRTCIDAQIFGNDIVTQDDRHNEILCPTSDSQESILCELVHVRKPYIGKVEKEMSRRGLRHAALLELITFLVHYSMEKIRDFPIYTLGAPADVWYGFKRQGIIHLNHHNPHNPGLPNSARFLGVAIEGTI
jgi:hypothetical protein